MYRDDNGKVRQNMNNTQTKEGNLILKKLYRIDRVLEPVIN